MAIAPTRTPTQLDSLPRSEQVRGPETDDRDIVHKRLDVDVAGSLGSGRAALDGLETDLDVDKVMDPAKLDLERFMAQLVTVHVHDAPDDNSPQFCEITVNGIYRCVVRGDTVDLPRSHVELLARAKHMQLVQKRNVNPDGSIGWKEEAILRHTYPFSVMHDPAGRRGGDWIKQLMRNPS